MDVVRFASAAKEGGKAVGYQLLLALSYWSILLKEAMPNQEKPEAANRACAYHIEPKIEMSQLDLI
jgi:hypothetical protein